MTTAMAGSQKGILGWIEKTGNRLPDPVFIFFYLIIALVVVSIVAAIMGYSAAHPTELNASGDPRIINAVSLLSADNIQKLWVDMPKTFTHFHPLGYVLVVMLGAGVAERTGLFATAMRAGVRNAPTFLLTPMVALVAMVGNLAADAAYVVLIPLAGVLFAAAGRHPVAGIAAAFAGVSGGFSANLLPGQLDALLFGITQEGCGGSLYPRSVAQHCWQLVLYRGYDVRLSCRSSGLSLTSLLNAEWAQYVPAGSSGKLIEDGDKPLTPEQKKGTAQSALRHHRRMRSPGSPLRSGRARR